jgi:hypothetical protein
MSVAARWQLRHAVRAQPGRWARAYDGTISSASRMGNLLFRSYDLDVAIRGFGMTVAVFARWAPDPGISRDYLPPKPRKRRRPAPRLTLLPRPPRRRQQPADDGEPRSNNRLIHSSHDPEPDGQRVIPGLRACRRCQRFLVIERGSWFVTDDGAAPCQGIEVVGG